MPFPIRLLANFQWLSQNVNVVNEVACYELRSDIWSPNDD